MSHREVPQIRMLVLDADGVLTDGSIVLADDAREIKRFDVRDGFGIRLWREAGLDLAVVTARTGAALGHRLKELGIERLVDGASDKEAAVRELSAQSGIGLDEMAYLGDDWPDVPAMRVVGYPMAVGDADADIMDAAVYRTTAIGGHGAVREAIFWILAKMDLLNAARSRYGLPAREHIRGPGAAVPRTPPSVPPQAPETEGEHAAHEAL